MEKPAQTTFDLHEIIIKRWSPLAFDSDKPVSRQQILTLLEAARWAPSCYGAQPWHFIVFDKNQDMPTWQQAIDCLAEANQMWAQQAPVLILAVTRNLFAHNEQPNRWAQYDCGAASENICLQAFHLGLIAHQMGGFDPHKAHEIFEIPMDFTCMAMIAIGYPGNPATLTEEQQKREMGERQRKPLEAIFFEGHWKNTL